MDAYARYFQQSERFRPSHSKQMACIRTKNSKNSINARNKVLNDITDSHYDALSDATNKCRAECQIEIPV